MKLKYYKEQYRFTLLRIFITKLLKKYSLGIKFTIIAVLSIFAFVSLINSPVEAQEVVEEEKTVLEQLIEEAPEVLIEEDKNNYEKFMEEGERIHEEKKKAYKEVEEKAFEFIVQFE
jgi:L-fucose mutarotase/ribose pyranase (RbsD/FucU family)